MSWQRILATYGSDAEEHFDRLKRRMGLTLGESGSTQILPYFGYGDAGRAFLHGRVLENYRPIATTDRDSLWDNLLNTYRRAESDEVPGAVVRASFAETVVDFVTNEEGFFAGWMKLSGKKTGDTVWRHVEYELLATTREAAGTTGAVMFPSDRAQYAVISDIDDTVLQTHADDLLRMARLVFLGNARTRLPFPGVAAFYRALQGGVDGERLNPIFYVSSSPWNLYDLIVEFLRLQRIPIGPVFLRDWGVTKEEFLPTRHRDHKLSAIERLLDFYSDLSFILIGDSGQEDPEIYEEIALKHPDRILAIYIRDVGRSPDRERSIRQLGVEESWQTESVLLADDTMAMAQHAAANGWIHGSSVTDIQSDIEQIQSDIEQTVSRPERPLDDV